MVKLKMAESDQLLHSIQFLHRVMSFHNHIEYIELHPHTRSDVHEISRVHLR